MKKIVFLLLLIISGVSYGQRFDLLESDYLSTSGVYNTVEGNKIKSFSTDTITAIYLRAPYWTDYEYTIIRNSIDTFYAHKNNAYIDAIGDSTYFVILYEGDTLYEVNTHVYHEDSLMDVYYESSNGDIVKTNSILNWDNEVEFDTVYISSTFFQNKTFDFKIDFLQIPDSNLVCRRNNSLHKLYQNDKEVGQLYQNEPASFSHLLLNQEDVFYFEYAEWPQECINDLYIEVYSNLMIVSDVITSSPSLNFDHIYWISNDAINFSENFEQAFITDFKGAVVARSNNANSLSVENLRGNYIVSIVKNNEFSSVKLHLK